jgi:hypothetical protein
VFAWLLESDPDNLQQALAREIVLKKDSSTDQHSSSKIKEDYRLLLRNENGHDEFEHQLLVSRLLERFSEHLAYSPLTEE